MPKVTKAQREEEVRDYVKVCGILGHSTCCDILSSPDANWVVMTREEFRSKKARGSRRKGRGNESKIVKGLNNWINGIPEDLGRFERRGIGFSGADVISPGWFPFKIEIKKQETFDPADIVLHRRTGLWSWWEQAKEQATERDKWPMLIVGKNFTPDYLLVSVEGWAWLVRKERSSLSPSRCTVRRVATGGKLEAVKVALLSDLLSIDPAVYLEGKEMAND